MDLYRLVLWLNFSSNQTHDSNVFHQCRFYQYIFE